jgi:hypothetical protein
MLLNASDLSYYVCFFYAIQYCRRARRTGLPGQECPKRVHLHKATNNFLWYKHRWPNLVIMPVRHINTANSKYNYAQAKVFFRFFSCACKGYNPSLQWSQANCLTKEIITHERYSLNTLCVVTLMVKKFAAFTGPEQFITWLPDVACHGLLMFMCNP